MLPFWDSTDRRQETISRGTVLGILPPPAGSENVVYIKQNDKAHLPVLEQVAGTEAVVGEFLQSHARAGVVENVDHKVAHREDTPDDAYDLCAQDRCAGSLPLLPIARVFLVTCSILPSISHLLFSTSVITHFSCHEARCVLKTSCSLDALSIIFTLSLFHETASRVMHGCVSSSTSQIFCFVLLQ